MSRPAVCLLCLAALAATACPGPGAVAPPGVVPGAGDYGGVTRGDLVGVHICRATGERRATFRWEFTETGFDLSGDGGPIPPEVLLAVLGRHADVVLVQGKWDIDGRSLQLRDVRAFHDVGADPVVSPDVTLAPYRTPVVRFEFGETQYVLGP